MLDAISIMPIAVNAIEFSGSSAIVLSMLSLALGKLPSL